MNKPTPILTSRFEEAMVYAHQLHRAQTRKGNGNGTPYMAHLLSVAALVLENGADEDIAIAALLHDAVEDQGGLQTAKEIETRFGKRVLSIVEGCTDTDQEPKPPWRERKEQYLNHLTTERDPAILLVSICDKLHNLRSTQGDLRLSGNVIWERFRGGQEGSLWYYRTLLETYRAIPIDAPPQPLIEELERVLMDVERLSVER